MTNVQAIDLFNYFQKRKKNTINTHLIFFECAISSPKEFVVLITLIALFYIYVSLPERGRKWLRHLLGDRMLPSSHLFFCFFCLLVLIFSSFLTNVHLWQMAKKRLVMSMADKLGDPRNWTGAEVDALKSKNILKYVPPARLTRIDDLAIINKM